MGDYRGDYYSGDPGFFSLLGRVVKGAAGAFFGGGGGTRIITLPPAGTAAPIIPRATAAIAGLGRRALGTVVRHPVLSAAGAAGTIGALGVGAGRAMAPGGMPMRGFHVSRRTGALVRNRRMRVTNPRALRRAIRRCTGFARLAKRVLRFTSPKPPKGRPYFRAKRRRK